MTLKELFDKGGKGFLLKDGKLALTKCPECHLENYAANVLSGICTWCGCDVNEKK